MLAPSSGIMMRRGTSRRLRYAPPLAAAAVHSAIVFVAFAGMGGTPVNSSAGNAMKLPPPATEFSAPPSTPATKRRMPVSIVKALGVTETLPRRQSPSRSPITCVIARNLRFFAETSWLSLGYIIKMWGISYAQCHREFRCCCALQHCLGTERLLKWQPAVDARHGHVWSRHVSHERHADACGQQ